MYFVDLQIQCLTDYVTNREPKTIVLKFDYVTNREPKTIVLKFRIRIYPKFNRKWVKETVCACWNYHYFIFFNFIFVCGCVCVCVWSSKIIYILFPSFDIIKWPIKLKIST